MNEDGGKKKRRKLNWAPYLLILPSVIYLVVFFAWPMISGLRLAVYNEEAKLSLREEALEESDILGHLPQGTLVNILDEQGNYVSEEDLEEGNIKTETWFQITSEDADGNPVAGWAPERRIRVREETEDGTPVAGTVRTKLGATADPQTSVYAEPNENSEVVGKLEARAVVEIKDQIILEVWFKISGDTEGETIEGWSRSRYIQVFEDETLASYLNRRGEIEELKKEYEKLDKLVKGLLNKSSIPQGGVVVGNWYCKPNTYEKQVARVPKDIQEKYKQPMKVTTWKFEELKTKEDADATEKE